MQESAQYRVIDRKRFVLVMVVILSVIAPVAWIGLDHFADYTQRLQNLAETDPAKAAAAATQLVRKLAVINALLMCSLTAIIIWYGLRSWRAKSMPPPGSWILEGQRTWSGESAVRIAKFAIAVGALLGILAVAGSAILWSLSATFANAT